MLHIITKNIIDNDPIMDKLCSRLTAKKLIGERGYV